MSFLRKNSLVQSLLSGLAGAVALNVLHETVRQFVPEAPRADILGMRSIAKGFEKTGHEVPDHDTLYPMAMLGDVVSNAAYYSLVGLHGQRPILTGAALGALAGVGATTLPGPMGLGKAPTTRTPATTAMTVGWYLFGGLVAGAVYERFRRPIIA